MFAMIDVVWFAAGGALVWFYKDKIQAAYLGANAFAARLEATAAAVKSAVSK